MDLNRDGKNDLAQIRDAILDGVDAARRKTEEHGERIREAVVSQATEAERRAAAELRKTAERLERKLDDQKWSLLWLFAGWLAFFLLGLLVGSTLG